MTRKDYKILAGVMKQYECEHRGDEQLKRHQIYFHILKRLIDALRKDNKRFDADKFMREIDKVE